jgi:signal transduction histidine kinase
VDTHRGLSKTHRIVAETPERLLVHWDVVRIDQVLTNLLTNAVKYTAGGTIAVTLTVTAGDIVEVAVRDHGPGISEAVKAELFERYYRAPHDGTATSTGSLEGMGIGLYISHKIALAHGGDLRVEDTPGGGATFILSLPRDTKR